MESEPKHAPASPAHQALFREHNRAWQHNRYVYPVLSRRSRGMSIGVNLNPDKACNFDCVYCSVDRTIAGAAGAIDLNHLAAELHQMIGLVAEGGLFEATPFATVPPALRRLNDVAFSGDGEPTACRQFDPAVDLAIRLLEPHPSVRLILITNATLLHRPEVSATLGKFGSRSSEIWAKLDAGTQAYYERIDRTAVPLERVLDNIRDLGRKRPVVIQSMFLRWQGAGPDDAELDAWRDRLAGLLAEGCRIDRVQVYTVARPTAEADAQSLSAESLQSIAMRARVIGLPTEVFAADGT